MGPPCNGNDCCDTDAIAHPPAHAGQPPFYAMPDKCGSYDYDCDGNADPEYGNTLSCAGIPATGCINHCMGVPSCMSGFLGGDPGCGMTATFGNCQSNSTGLACVPTSTGMQTQQCN